MHQKSNKNTRRSLLSALLVFCLCLSIFSPAEAARRSRAKTGATDKYAAFVMDATTGQVLYERYADKPLYPASLTKMMTLYLAFEALETGKITRSQSIWVSSHAASMPPSRLGLKPDSRLKVEDAILALVTKSANDAAVALAEALGGTESRFARMMTDKAAQLGMSRTTFKNASGLHDRNQFSSARDMAILSRALITNYPRYYRYFSTKSFSYGGATFSNHNKLLYSYAGMDGIKTGYVEPSGFNLAASAVRNGRRLIGVVFGGRSAASRNQHMVSLLDNGFAKMTGETRVAAAEIPSSSLNAISTLASPARPARKPASATSLAYATTAVSASNPEFDNMMGLLVDPGQGDIDPDQAKSATATLSAMAKTNGGLRPDNKKDAAPQQTWAIQLGAFSDAPAGQQAVQKAANRLPYNLRRMTEPKIVPLETARGTIWRARLAGLSHANAATACRILAGNCLVLAEQ